MSARVAIAVTPGFEGEAQRLADSLQLELTGPNDSSADFLLLFEQDCLKLRQTGQRAPGAVFVDFVAGKSAYRRNQGEGRKTPLARAMGFKSGFVPSVIDATAGLGQDALVLATLGCRITLVEQSPIVHALLEDGLRRGAESPQTRDIIERMPLIHANAAEYLLELLPDERPDAVYLDPMYPHRGRKALSKKEMQSFQKLLGRDQSGPLLLQAARAVAGKRVAVKRPVKAPFLGNETADFQIIRSKVRFDVYLSARPPDSVFS